MGLNTALVDLLGSCCDDDRPADATILAEQIAKAMKSPGPIKGPSPSAPPPSPGNGTITLPPEFGFGSSPFKVREGTTTSFRVEAVDCLAAATEFALRRLEGKENPTTEDRKTMRVRLSSDKTEAERVLVEIQEFATNKCGLSAEPRFGDGEKKSAQIGSWSFCFSYDCEWVGGRSGLQSRRGRR